MISCSLSPNTETDDVWLALKVMLSPGIWKKGSFIDEAERWFSDYFRDSEAVSFNSGRSALLGILKAFNIGQGDEVLVQAFTCVAVPNSVLWAGAKPVFVDIDETLNVDVQDARSKISSKTKALIVQHTFGSPADMKQLTIFAKKHGIFLIEDCAHSLGALYNGKKVGSFGDASFFSFGRDKVISSVWGGMGVIRAKHKAQCRALRTYQRQLPIPSLFWIFQQLFHPIAFSVILASYNIWLGKILLFGMQKFHLLSFPVYSDEKKSKRPAGFPAIFPNALAILALNQLKKLDRYNRGRRAVAAYFRKRLYRDTILPDVGGSIYLRFPFVVNNPSALIERAKKHGVLFGNWYQHIIDPAGVSFFALGYKIGSCPRAEYIASRIVNLPTRVSLTDAAKIVSLCLNKSL